MEKGINAYILSEFEITQRDLRTYSPLVLAYIGDGVYDLVIRSMVVGKGNTGVNRLHKRTSGIVKAESQAKMVEALLPDLSQEEKGIYRRGRNAKSPTMAKNATMSDYRKATGFEAVMGYLYLKNEFARMVELIRLGLGRTGQWQDVPSDHKGASLDVLSDHREVSSDMPKEGSDSISKEGNLAISREGGECEIPGIDN